MEQESHHLTLNSYENITEKIKQMQQTFSSGFLKVSIQINFLDEQREPVFLKR